MALSCLSDFGVITLIEFVGTSLMSTNCFGDITLPVTGFTSGSFFVKVAFFSSVSSFFEDSSVSFSMDFVASVEEAFSLLYSAEILAALGSVSF